MVDFGMVGLVKRSRAGKLWKFFGETIDKGHGKEKKKN
jgi:hypothetical protein